MSTNIGKGFKIKPGKDGARTTVKASAKYYTSTSAAIGAKKKPERIVKRLRANRERSK